MVSCLDLSSSPKISLIYIQILQNLKEKKMETFLSLKHFGEKVFNSFYTNNKMIYVFSLFQLKCLQIHVKVCIKNCARL